MSHFSFTRSAYDQCALDKKLQESTGPFNYATDSEIIESKQSCFLGASPFMHNQFPSIPKESIDIESDLRGQTRNLSKCPSQKYNPNQQAPFTSSIKECTDITLVPEYTRINKPCNIFSGITINRFHPLCDDVQSLNKIHNNTYIGINTRLHVKDSFKNKKQA
jgi:hypothetical protein